MGNAKGFDRRQQALASLAASDEQVAKMIADATPPLAAAPAAPARGPMAEVDNWVMMAGGTRRLDGRHMRDLCQLEVMCVQAWQRHQARGIEAEFVPPFTPGQIAVGRAYRDLVEWREGSALKCASLEAGRAGGGGSGLFIDAFIQQGDWLQTLRNRIGETVVILSVRRHMDRGNARRPIMARAAVDGLLLQGLDLSAILANHRWQLNGKNRKALRLGVADALDRMQGGMVRWNRVLSCAAEGWAEDVQAAIPVDPQGVREVDSGAAYTVCAAPRKKGD